MTPAKNHLKEISALISPVAAGSLIYALDLGDELKREISEYVSPLLQAYNSLSPNERLLLVGGSVCLLGIGYGIGYRIKSNKEGNLEKRINQMDERLKRLEKESKIG